MDLAEPCALANLRALKRSGQGCKASPKRQVQGAGPWGDVSSALTPQYAILS